MRKYLIILVLTTLLITLVPSMSLAYTKNIDEIKGLTYLNLPENSFGGEIVKSELQIKNMVLNNNTLIIQGEVNYNGNSLPFNIIGNIKKSFLHNNGVTAKLKDNLSNFEVIHFSLADIQSQEEECSLINEKKRAKIISLYLLKKDSREFSVFEGEIGNLKENKHLIEDILSNNSILERSSKFAEYWAPSVFKPLDGGASVVSVDIDDKTGEEIIVPEREKLSKNDSEIISILNSDEYFVGDGSTKDFEYWETWNQGIDCTVTYRIHGRVKTALGSSFGGTSIEILDKNTTSNCAYFIKDDSPLGIGTYSDPVKITATTNGYDEFIDLSMDYSDANKKYTGNFNVNIGVGISYKGVSLGAAYNYDLEELFTITTDSTPTKMLTNYSTSTEFPHKIQGKYDSMLLPFEGSQFYLHGNMYDKTADTSVRSIDSYTYFNVSADYENDLKGFVLATYPDRYFDINTWKFGAN